MLNYPFLILNDSKINQSNGSASISKALNDHFQHSSGFTSGLVQQTAVQCQTWRSKYNGAATSN